MKKCNQKWFNPQKVKKQIAIAVAISLVCAIPISTFAQVLKFSIKKSNTSIQSVLQELEKESGYTLVVSKEYLLQACRKVRSVEKIKRRMEWLRPWN